MHYTEDGFTSIYPSLIDTAFTGMKTINEYDDDEFTPSIAVGTDGKAFRLVVFENVNEISRKYELSIYPNPVTDGLFTLKLSNPLIDESQIFIYTIDGRMVYQEKLPLRKHEISITTALPNGMYFLQLHDGKNHYSEKFLIGN